MTDLARAANERLLRAMTEAQFQKQVEGIAAWMGWGHYHAPDNRPVAGRRGSYVQNVRAGFPDLVLWHPKHGVIFAELKREGGRLTPDQMRVHAELRAAGAVVYVWRPRDLSQVEDILRLGPTAEREAS